MDITGTIVARGNTNNEAFSSASGAFSVGGTQASWGLGTADGISGKSYGTVTLKASDKWTGSTSKGTSHNHSFSSSATIGDGSYIRPYSTSCKYLIRY